MHINQTQFILSYFLKIRNPLFPISKGERTRENELKEKKIVNDKREKYIYHVRSNWIFLMKKKNSLNLWLNIWFCQVFHLQFRYSQIRNELWNIKIYFIDDDYYIIFENDEKQ